MREDSSENSAWTTAEDLDGKDLFSIWKSSRRVLISSLKFLYNPYRIWTALKSTSVFGPEQLLI